MKKLYPLLCILFFTWHAIQSQVPVLSWSYESPGGNGGLDQAFTVIQTSDTGYMLAGRTGSVGVNAGDFYFIKLDAGGNFKWSKIYSSNYIDEVHGIVQSADGGYVATGVTADFPDTSVETSNLEDVIAIKLDASGDTVWTRHFGAALNDIGEAIDTTGDGGFIIVGRSGSVGNGNDFYLVRIDANGDSLWTRTYGGTGSDIAYAVKHTNDDGYIIAGTTESFGTAPGPGAGNIWLMKINAAGDTLWTQAIGGTNVEQGYGVISTRDGGYILTGSTGTSSVQSDIYVVKTDSLGRVQWTKTYPSSGIDAGKDIVQTSDGGYALTGIKFDPQGYAPLMYVLKMDSAGNKLWDASLGNDASPNGAKGHCIKQTIDGGLVVAGENDMGSGSLDNRAYVVKYEGDVTTGIEGSYLTSNNSIYPNPFTESAIIIFPASLTTVGRLDIYNTTGQLILGKEISSANGKIELQRGGLVAGMYFYEITGTGDTNYKGKFVVQ